MDIPQAAPPPAAPPVSLTKQKRSWIPYGIFGFALLALLILLGVGYWYSNTSMSAFRTVHFLSGPFESRTLSEFGFQKSNTVTLPVPGHVVDYAHSRGIEAVISVQSNKSEDIYKIQGGKSTALTTDGKIKSGVSVSLDGTMIAYATRISTATSTNAVDFYAPNAWSIELLKGSAAPTVIGTGYGPQFFARGAQPYLMYTTDKGIHLVNLATNTHQDIPISFGVPTASRVASISNDGTHVLLPDVGTGYALFTLTYTGSLATITPVGSLPTPTDVAAFSGNTIISVSHNAMNVLFRTSSLGAPSTIQKAVVAPQSIIFKLVP